MRAFAGFHAFPGGSLDPEDAQIPSGATNLTDEEAASALGADAGEHRALSFYVCCLRELFEEVGILLVEKDGRDYLPGEVELARLREALAGGSPLAEAVLEWGWVLDASALHFRARWLAPEGIPVRFDVRVFVCEFRGQIRRDPAEVAGVDWHTASEVLMAAEAGTIMLAPPTMATVDSLAAYESVGALLEGHREGGNRPMEQHSAKVRRLVAPNPSLMTGPGTNTYLLGTDELIVIDPGTIDREHLGRLIGAGKIETVVITHHHPDHVSGAGELADYAGAEVAASEGFWAMAKLYTDGRRLKQGDVVEVPGVKLEVLETPGHASDHIALWFDEEEALFSGDLILGEGTTVISPPDGDLVDYLASLEKVKELAPKVIYPGHFDPRTDATDWINHYITHRHEREEEVLAALEAGVETPAEITKIVYSAYPSELHPIAERSVLAHLQKLTTEGRVLAKGDLWTLKSPKGDD